MRRRALVTGITGQVGSYLAEHLVAQGYEVHGLVRSQHPCFENIAEVCGEVILHYGDLVDEGRLIRLIEQVAPDEIYNLAAQTHVQISFDQPVWTGDITALGPLRIFDAVRRLGAHTRIYQASSSEMFGSSPAPQHLETPLRPRSPYAIAKAYAHGMAAVYRESYGLFIVRGIMFNAESPRRAHHFVTRKVTRKVAELTHAKGDGRPLVLGNLAAKRDWGWAPDYVRAIHETLQKPAPGDYVIATGETHSVEELVRFVLELAWKHYGVALDFNKHVVANHAPLIRPLEVDELRGVPSFATLDWRPTKTFEEVIERMFLADYEALED